MLPPLALVDELEGNATSAKRTGADNPVDPARPRFAARCVQLQNVV
ncbi:MAG: hypothetical protein HYV96_02095 [Opitutae bacterium]|nr:hypothetical protein [Opitutae bacterium]